MNKLPDTHRDPDNYRDGDGNGNATIEKIEREQSKGEQHVQWNAEGLPAGMYYYRIQADHKLVEGRW